MRLAARLWFSALLMAPSVGLAQSGPSCAQFQRDLDVATVHYAQTLSTLPAAFERYHSAEASYNEFVADMVRRFANSADSQHLTGYMATYLFAAEQLRRTMLSAEQDLEAIFSTLLEQEKAAVALSAATEAACAGQAEGQSGDAAQSVGGATPAPPLVAQTTRGTPAPGPATAAQPAADQPGTPGIAAGFWHDNGGHQFYSDGQNLYNIPGGELSLGLTCGGHGTNARGREGTLCTGTWYRTNHRVGGSFEGVAFIRSSNGEHRLEGIFDQGPGTVADDWTFGRYSDEEVASRSLTVPAGP